MVPRLAWVDPDEATGSMANLYAAAHAADGVIADIHKTFSGHPKALEGMLALSSVAFPPGVGLTSAQREIVATHVSVILGCHY